MFKKLQHLVGLTVFSIFSICLSTHGFYEFHEGSRFDKKYVQNITTIIKGIGKVLAVELDHIAKQISNENETKDEDIDLDQVEKLINQVLPAIKTKIAHFVIHDLTKEQRIIAINLLKNSKALSATTVDDLMSMGKASIDKALEVALEKYCPEKLKKYFLQHTPDNKMNIELYEKFEKVDLQNVSFNNIKRFMCNCVYLEDMLFIPEVDLNDDKQELLIQQLFIYIIKTIAFPFVVFNNDIYFSKECCKHEFQKAGRVFLIMNAVCNELLEAINH